MPNEPTTGAGTWSGGFPAVRTTGEHASIPADSPTGRVGRSRAASVRLFGVVSLEVPHATPHASHGAVADGARAGTPVGAPVAPTGHGGDPGTGGEGRGGGGGGGRRDGALLAAPPVDGTEVLAYRDVAAVLAPASYVADPLTPRDLDRYREVIDAVFAHRAVVPAPPGTVFRSRELVAGWLELHYYTLVEALSFLEDRAAARVSVTRAEPTPAPSLRLAPADTMEIAIAGDLTSLAAESFRALRTESVALLILRAGPDAVAPDASAHGSFLVERRRWREFEQAVGVEAARHPGLRFQITGPWPPYDFVRMQFSS